MRKVKKIYDFSDFVDAVRIANARTVVKPMDFYDFHEWKDGHSVQRVNNIKVNDPKPYLAQIIQIRATRKSTNLEYKISFYGPTYKLDFL